MVCILKRAGGAKDDAFEKVNQSALGKMAERVDIVMDGMLHYVVNFIWRKHNVQAESALRLLQADPGRADGALWFLQADQLIQLFFAVLIIMMTIRLMIKKKTSVTISLLWLLIGFAAMVIAIFPQILSWVSRVLGISSAPLLVIVSAIIGLMMMIFYLSSEIAIAHNKIRELSIQLSLVNDEVLRIKQHHEGDGGFL